MIPQYRRFQGLGKRHNATPLQSTLKRIPVLRRLHGRPDVCMFISPLRRLCPLRRVTLCSAAFGMRGTEGANWIGITVRKPGLIVLTNGCKQIGLVACKSEAVWWAAQPNWILHNVQSVSAQWLAARLQLLLLLKSADCSLCPDTISHGHLLQHLICFWWPCRDVAMHMGKWISL